MPQTNNMVFIELRFVVMLFRFSGLKRANSTSATAMAETTRATSQEPESRTPIREMVDNTTIGAESSISVAS